MRRASRTALIQSTIVEPVCGWFDLEWRLISSSTVQVNSGALHWRAGQISGKPSAKISLSTNLNGVTKIAKGREEWEILQAPLEGSLYQ